jgi:hypothetical protein
VGKTLAIVALGVIALILIGIVAMWVIGVVLKFVIYLIVGAAVVGGCLYLVDRVRKAGRANRGY